MTAKRFRQDDSDIHNTSFWGESVASARPTTVFVNRAGAPVHACPRLALLSHARIDIKRAYITTTNSSPLFNSQTFNWFTPIRAVSGTLRGGNCLRTRAICYPQVAQSKHTVLVSFLFSQVPGECYTLRPGETRSGESSRSANRPGRTARRRSSAKCRQTIRADYELAH